jgi:hypothetical protein
VSDKTDSPTPGPDPKWWPGQLQDLHRLRIDASAVGAHELHALASAPPLSNIEQLMISNEWLGSQGES